MAAKVASDAPESTRERLLEAARDSFAQKGFHGTTTRDISAAAGMSPAAVYVHHRSKEAMLYEISLAGHLDLLEQLRSLPHTEPVSELAELVRWFVRSHAAGHTRARIVNYELGALSPEHRGEIDRLRHEIQSIFRTLIESGTRAGEFSCADAGMTVNAIMSMGIDVARWYDDDGAWSPEQVADHHAGLALRMVGAQPG